MIFLLDFVINLFCLRLSPVFINAVALQHPTVKSHCSGKANICNPNLLWHR